MICWRICTRYERAGDEGRFDGKIVAGDGGDRAMDAGAVRAGADGRDHAQASVAGADCVRDVCDGGEWAAEAEALGMGSDAGRGVPVDELWGVRAVPVPPASDDCDGGGESGVLSVPGEAGSAGAGEMKGMRCAAS